MSIVLCCECDRPIDCKHDDPDCFVVLRPSGKEVTMCSPCRDHNAERWQSIYDIEYEYEDRMKDH